MKVARTVLRGEGGSNPSDLPDLTSTLYQAFHQTQKINNIKQEHKNQ